MESFTSVWRCSHCDTQNEMSLTKVQAAFFDCEKYKKKRSPCTNCGSMEYKALSHAGVDIDRELLEIWIGDNDAFFMSQDEELLIADADSNILFSFLNRPNIPESKRLSLVEALIVRLTDNLASNSEEAQEISMFLKSNRHHWDGREEIWPYLQERAHAALNS